MTPEYDSSRMPVLDEPTNITFNKKLPSVYDNVKPTPDVESPKDFGDGVHEWVWSGRTWTIREKAGSETECNHSWEEYVGVMTRDWTCTKCGKRTTKEPNL